MKRLLIAPVLSLILTFLCVSSVFSETFIEDFATVAYKDELNTTANWDVDAGELRLSNQSPTLIGSCEELEGRVWNVVISGKYAYVTAHQTPYGFQVFDISDPAAPFLVGRCDTGEGQYYYGTYGIAVSGNYAYVGLALFQAGGSGLLTIDISDPTNPVIINNCGLINEGWGVTIWGHYAFVADGNEERVFILDISDPGNPTLVYEYVTKANAYDVEIFGTLAYIGEGMDYKGLEVLDISNPANPIFVNELATPSYIYDMAISGNYLYAANEWDGLQIIDISDPGNPTLAGNYDSEGYATGVDIFGKYAYITVGPEGLDVVDIANPTSPVLVDNYPTEGWSSNALDIAGDYLYMGDAETGLEIVEVSVTVSPEILGSHSLSCSPSIHDVIAHNNLVFITMGCYSPNEHVLKIFDAADPDNAILVGQCTITDSYVSNICHEAKISGHYLYTPMDGLKVIDISDPTNPSVVGGLDVHGRDIEISGQYLYIAGDDLYVVDISDALNPVLVGTFETFGGEQSVTVSGNYAYLATDRTFEVFDITDSANPALIGQLDFNPVNYFWKDMAAWGNYIFVADGHQGVRVIDVADPGDPQLVTEFDITAYAYSRIKIIGNTAYVGARCEGIDIIDISDPTNLELIEQVYLDDMVWVFDIEGTHCYTVADYYERLYKLKISKDKVELFEDSNVGQSLTVSDTENNIKSANLNPTMESGDSGTVAFQMTNDGGLTWKDVIPAEEHTFTSMGSSLCWRAILSTSDESFSPSVESIRIDYRVNQRPTAVIDSISPNPATIANTVTLVGHGEDEDGDVVDYNWRSSIDGNLGNGSTLLISTLSIGTHTIFFKVKDNDNAWSDKVSQQLIIESGEKGSIYGRVLGYHWPWLRRPRWIPLEGATVKARGLRTGTAKGVQTDENGAYRINNLPKDIYVIQVSKVGYWRSIRAIYLPKDRERRVNFHLFERFFYWWRR